MSTQNIHTISFIKELGSFSKPMHFTCSDFNTYFIKIPLNEGDYDDLIYEVIANRLAVFFEIPTPKFEYIGINHDSYNISDLNANRSQILNTRYGFGSKEVINHEILSNKISSIQTKRDFNTYLNPLDFIRIGILDAHLTNTDRTHGNFNIILDLNLEPGQKKFVAIDHVAIFGGNAQKNRFEPRTDENVARNILNTNFGRSVLKFASKDHDPASLLHIIDSYFQKVDQIPSLISACFETFPESWTYNIELKERIIRYLVNPERNLHLQTELRRLLNYSIK